MTWTPPQASQKIFSAVSIPGSKSLSNRELLLSAIACEPTKISGLLRSQDTDFMVEALRALGCQIEFDSPSSVTVIPTDLSVKKAHIDCGLAGTVMRFVPALVALTNAEVSFDGVEAARLRPMKPLLDALAAQGCEIIYEDKEGFLPFTVRGCGGLPGGELVVDSSTTSQFLSALLIVAARAQSPLHLRTAASYPSASHVEMTLECLRRRGVRAREDSVHVPHPGRLISSSWRIEPGSIAGGEVVIEPDLSNAGPFIMAPLVAGGQVTVKNWPAATTQVGDRWREIVRALGGSATRIGNDMMITGSGKVAGIDIDLSDGGELVPTLAAACALAVSPSKIRGIAHISGHETDRLQALVTEVEKLGGKARVENGSLFIDPAPLRGADLCSYGDHRMATFAAIVALKVPGVTVDDVDCTAKTLPDFPVYWNKMLERD